LAVEPQPDVSQLAGLIDELPPELREEALTHSSWKEPEGHGSYKRLAFLGDSVLALAVRDAVYERFPEIDAGGLTKIHNQTVSGVSCTQVGRGLGVPQMLREMEPELPEAIPVATLLASVRPLAEVTEALIGACFVAFGFERVAPAVVTAFDAHIEFASNSPVDAKSALQELLGRRQARVTYAVIGVTGPPHRRVFEVEAVIDGKRMGTGAGRSKKTAEQAAAKEALRTVEE
jgi:ribonuclease III